MISNIFDNKKDDKDKDNYSYIIERLILISIIIDFLYICIALTGSINFLFYDFYSCQKSEYISLSGVVSLSQLIFRAVEFFGEPFNSNSFYIVQMIFSLFGIILTVIYVKWLLKTEINLCWCV